ncbi:MAG: substrate-binding domain-containing protein, partial [Planctomycetia bacterium]|nr:substrate-binding domain-containing protein [Planctomycetia bacterium]
RDGYIKRLREDGFEAFVYDSPRTKPRSQSRDEKKIARWLLELPHPIALFAANDEIGIYVMDICQQNGLRIPEDVAVLGVDNQEIVCQYHHPTLSSIETSIKECGFRYAQVLERLMRGEEEMGMVYSYTPTSVVSRQSTKIVCFEDPLVAQALEFIQTNFGTTIGVPDIVKFCNISRRTLETRFQKEVGHSILSEITRLRMEKLARLLRETNFPINELASLCGYLDDVYMGKVFHKNFHCSMSQYRKNSFDG